MSARLLRRAAIVLAIAAATHLVAIWAVPRVIMRVVIERSAAIAGGPNKPHHPPAVDDKSRWVVLPSPDLRYSTCSLDLSQGPVVVSATPPESYFSLSVFDAVTDNVFVISNATTGSGPIHLVIAGPGTAAPSEPAGAKLVTMPTEKGLLLLRALAATPELAAAADKARETLACGAL